MSKEKQIEKMIEIVKPFVSGCACEKESGSCEFTDCRSCNARSLVNKICEADYREKNEWISVDERLPEGKAPIIVTDGEKVIVAYRNWLYCSNGTGRLRCPANYGNGMYVTHWMPLPEAPKMKGGAE